jgi:NADPH:quinone reductase-like Zn-dependent oxidoreductase
MFHRARHTRRAASNRHPENYIRETVMATMTAVVIRTPGGPEVLRLEERMVPVPKVGQVLIRVKAFGLNRSELFTRRGFSPDVSFPRILGIEAVGVVEEAPGGEFQKDDVRGHGDGRHGAAVRRRLR